MKCPNKEQLAAALTEAERMRDEGEDQQNVAHALLCLAHRAAYLEEVRMAAERYVHFGLAEKEHTRLLKALDHAKAEAALALAHEEEELGLG